MVCHFHSIRNPFCRQHPATERLYVSRQRLLGLQGGLLDRGGIDEKTDNLAR